MRTRVKDRFQTASFQTKLIGFFVAAILIVCGMNVYLYAQVSHMMASMNTVYDSNISISSLQEKLNDVQDNLYNYLSGDYDSLNAYYQSKSALEAQVSSLNETATDNSMKLKEKNIRSMTGSYLELTDSAVAGHRGTDIEQYGASYEDASRIYQYLESMISSLNAERFAQNTHNYERLSQVQRYTQAMNLTLLVFSALLELMAIVYFTGQITRPLMALADRANLVGQGRLDMPPMEVHSEDEVGRVTTAFNQMTVRLNAHIRQQQEQLKEESRLKEAQLQLEAHLKDAQLGALQAQINPHFLYNTLNAGAQLALMEDAEKTCLFLERVSDYFRYNLRRSGGDVSLAEELAQVENYIYIMNTRYDGEIVYHREIGEEVPAVRLPGMVLQPLVENAIEHGLKDMEEERHLTLAVREEPERVIVSVADNGDGFPEGKAEVLLQRSERGLVAGDGRRRGIGMVNVIRRLRLYYDRDDVMEIESEPERRGTEIRILIPKGENGHVPNHAG